MFPILSRTKEAEVAIRSLIGWTYLLVTRPQANLEVQTNILRGNIDREYKSNIGIPLGQLTIVVG
jgi:hypothetical protein